VFILKIIEVVCFDTVLQVLILMAVISDVGKAGVKVGQCNELKGARLGRRPLQGQEGEGRRKDGLVGSGRGARRTLLSVAVRRPTERLVDMEVSRKEGFKL
jgi:hypothetical protein